MTPGSWRPKAIPDSYRADARLSPENPSAHFFAEAARVESVWTMRKAGISAGLNRSQI